MTNDKILNNINTQIEGLTSAVKNKMIETQLAQIVATIPISNDAKILAQPKNSFEKVNAVTMRGGKSTHDPPKPNQFTGKVKERQEAEPSTKTQKEQEEETPP